MNYKDRLYKLRNTRTAGVIQQAESERRLRHEIAMDSLAAERGLHGLSDEDRSIMEAATIEVLIIDSLLNTIPKGKRNKMIKKAVKKALSSVAEDLKYVVRKVIDQEESQLCERGNYKALRAGKMMAFSYYGVCYAKIDMEARTLSIVEQPNYATARRMVRYLAELCDVTLVDMREGTYAFEVIHETHP